MKKLFFIILKCKLDPSRKKIIGKDDFSYFYESIIYVKLTT